MKKAVVYQCQKCKNWGSLAIKELKEFYSFDQEKLETYPILTCPYCGAQKHKARVIFEVPDDLID